MTIVRTIGGVERRFGLLTVDDLMSITDTIPNPSGEIVDLRSLDKWAKNPRGCEVFLELSARKTEPGLRRPEVAKWGNLIERTNLAAELFVLSITTGEDVPSPKAPGVDTTPPTGS